MDKETINVVKSAIESMDKKEFGIHFFTMDTQGNPIASVANIYEHVRILRELGYNASILHEKNEYSPVTWLGEEYTEIPHISAEGSELKINPQDIIIVPEIYANVMEQLAKLPGYRIVMCQSYDYILEMLPPGKSWRDYGIDKCITTTQEQKTYIDNLFSNPHLKWITFRDMRGLPKDVFAKDLSESCLAVWVDDIAGFGTFPLEAIKCDVPVIGKVPNVVPPYFSDKNGLWTHDLNTIPDLISNYVQAWLEDSEPAELYTEMRKLKDEYTITQLTENVKEVYEKIFNERKENLTKSLPVETVLEGEVIEMGDNTEIETKQ
jgi:hypothetical protein